MLAATLTIFVGGCAVGPDFATPPAPDATTYTPEPVSERTVAADTDGGAAQHLQWGGDLPGAWWTLFGSADLSAMIDEAIANHPSIEAQQAALREAEQTLAAEQGTLFPTVSGAADRNRSKSNPALSGFPSTVPSFFSSVYGATLTVSYNLDLWGGERRSIEGMEAARDAERYALEASVLTLTSNLANQAITVASLRAQIAATIEIERSQTDQLALIRRRFALGSLTQADVLQQEALLAATNATLPGLDQQLALAQHQLAVLRGRLPADTPPAEFDLAAFVLPGELPVSLPSSLVRQRPDIRQQEALLHQASAEIGVATANMLPQIGLSGNFGGASTALAELLHGASNTWSLTGDVGQTLFDGGTLSAKRQAARAAFDQAAANYRGVVLTAFQSVADVLTALENDARALKAQTAALAAAKASLDLTSRRYAIGAVDEVTLLAAQQSYQTAKLAQVRATASRYQDTVLLFQALGGGWWNRDAAKSLRTAKAPIAMDHAE